MRHYHKLNCPNNMKTVKDIKHMIREPASKDWFAKHGLPKSIVNHPMKAKAQALSKAKK